MRMYSLIMARLASKQELEEWYTLDEALKLYALHRMNIDVENGRLDSLKNREGRQ